MKSKCCNRTVKVVGDTTMHYMCKGCGEACDVPFVQPQYTSKTHVTTCEEQVEEFENYFYENDVSPEQVDWLKQALLTAEKRVAEDTAGYIKDAREEGRREERERIAKSLNQNLPPAGKFMYKDIIQDALNQPLTDNCFVCGKEVPKPEDSPKDRKRWVDKCEECKD